MPVGLLRPTVWAASSGKPAYIGGLEPYAGKLARTVLRGAKRTTRLLATRFAIRMSGNGKRGINKIITIIEDYLAGSIEKSAFDRDYPVLLQEYDEEIQDPAYYPLDILAPSDNNSEASWKENMKNMYLSEIYRLIISRNLVFAV